MVKDQVKRREKGCLLLLLQNLWRDFHVVLSLHVVQPFGMSGLLPHVYLLSKHILSRCKVLFSFGSSTSLNTFLYIVLSLNSLAICLNFLYNVVLIWPI